MKSQENMSPEVQIMQDEAMQSIMHDLRTPISVIKGYLEILLSGIMGEVTEEQKHLLQRSAGRLQDLIHLTDNMLHSVKLQNNQVSLNLQATPLDALLQETIDFYGIAFKQRGMHFQRDGNTMGLTLRVDPYWLRRVLHNLIWNAYKFTPDRGSVSLQVDRNGAGVEISVQDTGSGVSEEDLVRIFNKFEQGGTEKDKERGHGLGLWICKKIVELHGGRIRAESSFGQGSRFCIILPAGAIITR